MKKWIFSALLVLVALTAVISQGEFLQHPRPEPAAVESRTDPLVSRPDIATASLAPVTYPKVDSKHLLTHIKALNYKRHTQSERDRARNYLTQTLKKLGWSPALQPFASGINVLATRPGTETAAGAVLVAAHYDTVAVSPGADDNSTGVAVVLEVARLLGSRPTPRTLHLVFFDQEEQGLQGSLAFATNKVNLDNLQGVIVMDMLGYACHKAGCQHYPEGLPITPATDIGNFLAVVGDTEHLPLLETFQKSGQPNLPPMMTLPVPFKGMLTPDVLRSDHAPFWYQGVGAVLLTDTANLRTPHYHQPSDQPATLDHSFFTGSAQIVVNATTRLLENRS